MRSTIRKGDLVEVITGEDKGRQGKVLAVDARKGKVLIEGINMVKRHERPRGSSKPGGIIDKPAYIDRSNVMLICPKCSRRSRASWVRRGDKRIRVCKKCGGELGS
ncbi:50S ribosomal protein L24 [candidate division WOR-3 bacterium]|uniref:Large ribosomal subunit protein uL24 n=1 Tax=candidate division WOR-3 bacterium TaxID=2052148 RepID=A0A9D5K9K2_UNCW3|nr:50S ribosomal protein L24 [candidate division WOR-3 bacterium]MBD3363801.1 50S ribosomal protein L24 [candidate division WOR-3 bacterium]